MRQPQLEEPEPRTIEQLCPACRGEGKVIKLDGLHFRRLRKKAKMTLVEVGRICHLAPSHLAAMEVGEHPFRADVAVMYERLFERRRKAGEE